MIRILDRLVAGQFLKLFFVSILATPPLFILGEITEELDRYVDMGLSTGQVAQGYMFRVVEYVVWSFPIAALLAAVFTVYSMTSHREIVAAKAGGISFHRLTLPIVLMGIVLTGAALALTELVPRTNQIAFQILRNEDPRRAWRSDFVYQSENGLTLAVRRLTMLDSSMTGILVQHAGDEEGPAFHVEADDANYDPETGWDFHLGFLRMIERDGTEEAYQFDHLRLPSLVEQPQDLLSEPPEDEEMSYAELERTAQIIERWGGKAHELRVKKEQRVAIPAATLVIILFGVPLATSSKRGGTAYGIGAALGTTILYVSLLKVAGAFGSSGAVPPWIVWTPNAFFLLAGLVLLAKVRT